jgi:hypothetical protein
MGYAILAIIVGLYLILKANMEADLQNGTVSQTVEDISSVGQSLVDQVKAYVADITLSSVLGTMARAIQRFEGWVPGSRSFRNNNPGNLRYADWEKSFGAVNKDPQGFAIFGTYEQGFSALIHLLGMRVTQHPEWTVYDLFNSYAPASDGNDPQSYAQYVASALGIDATTQLGGLV